MNRRALQVLFSALFLAPPAACSREAFESAREGSIDSGNVEHSTYRNQYLGFTITLPTDWDIQTGEVLQALMDRGAEMVAGDEKNRAAAMDAAKQSTLPLFAAFKLPPGSPVDFNPNMISIAESLLLAPGVKTGADFLFHHKKNLEHSAMQVSFPRDIERTSLGGREFGMLYLEMPISGTVVRQECYVTIIKGYALGFTLSYSSNEEAASLKSTLGTVSFEM